MVSFIILFIIIVSVGNTYPPKWEIHLQVQLPSPLPEHIKLERSSEGLSPYPQMKFLGAVSNSSSQISGRKEKEWPFYKQWNSCFDSRHKEAFGTPRKQGQQEPGGILQVVWQRRQRLELLSESLMENRHWNNSAWKSLWNVCMVHWVHVQTDYYCACTL